MIIDDPFAKGFYCPHRCISIMTGIYDFFFGGALYSYYLATQTLGNFIVVGITQNRHSANDLWSHVSLQFMNRL
jgi:hypothetical protein